MEVTNLHVKISQYLDITKLMYYTYTRYRILDTFTLLMHPASDESLKTLWHNEQFLLLQQYFNCIQQLYFHLQMYFMFFSIWIQSCTFATGNFENIVKDVEFATIIKLPIPPIKDCFKLFIYVIFPIFQMILKCPQSIQL